MTWRSNKFFITILTIIFHNITISNPLLSLLVWLRSESNTRQAVFNRSLLPLSYRAINGGCERIRTSVRFLVTSSKPVPFNRLGTQPMVAAGRFELPLLTPARADFSTETVFEFQPLSLLPSTTRHTPPR